MSDTLTREQATNAIKIQLAYCERQIANYSLKMAADPTDAVVFAVDIAKHGFTARIWEWSLQVINGERTLKNLEASLSSRLISLCGRGTGCTVDSMLTDKIEMACIETALDKTGQLGLLKAIDPALPE